MSEDDLIGKKFGRWTVIEKSKSKPKHLLCMCSCGTIRDVSKSHLINNNTKSCGCIGREKASKRMTERNLKHNLSNTRLFSLWHCIKQRCYYKNDIGYKNYGGRGIEMCDEWHNNFKSFYDWAINNGYKEEILPNGKNKWTIDRIDVNGNYEPSNCRWVTIKEQSNNKTTNRLLKYNNKVKTISQWSEDTGISHTTICDRLKYGWSVEDALKYKPRGKKTIELNNKLDLLLEYIIGFYKDNKREPSFIEIRDNLSYNKSGSCLCNHLDILEKRGKIKRIKRQKNNIVLGEQDETNRRESSELHQEIPRRTQPNADSARNS